MASYEATKKGYRNLWNAMRVERVAECDQAADGIAADRARYEVVEARTGVPWFWIALVHLRESGRDFAGVLHNGEKIIGTGRVTTLYPPNRGPFETWEAAAVDALAGQGLHKIDDWPLERCLYELERYNGQGYMKLEPPSRRICSPYVWAGTNHYAKGKYVADGRFDPEHVDRQLGTAAVLARLALKDASVAEALDLGTPTPGTPSDPSLPGGLAAHSTDDLIEELLRRKIIVGVSIDYGLKQP